jgi:hypothetical protein
MYTKLGLINLMIFSLMGCEQKSDIDKCIEAKWEYHTLLLKHLDNSLKEEHVPIPKLDELKTKLNFRMECLRAQAGSK